MSHAVKACPVSNRTRGEIYGICLEQYDCIDRSSLFRLLAAELAVTDDEFRNLAIAELDAVYRLASHLTRSSPAADDAVQETYLRAFRSASTFTLCDVGMRPWLFKILCNVIYTTGSKGKREKIALLDLQYEKHSGNSSGELVDLSTFDWEWIDERLKQAILELPEQYRAAFLLSAVESLRYHEIAEVLAVPIGTVMSRLSRARVMLAERLNNVSSDFGFRRSSGTAATDSKERL